MASIRLDKPFPPCTSRRCRTRQSQCPHRSACRDHVPRSPGHSGGGHRQSDSRAVTRTTIGRDASTGQAPETWGRRKSRKAESLRKRSGPRSISLPPSLVRGRSATYPFSDRSNPGSTDRAQTRRRRTPTGTRARDEANRPSRLDEAARPETDRQPGNQPLREAVRLVHGSAGSACAPLFWLNASYPDPWVTRSSPREASQRPVRATRRGW